MMDGEPTPASQARVDGSGALAQGGSTALGQGAVHVGGNVGGGINTGIQNIVNLVLPDGELNVEALAQFIAQHGAKSGQQDLDPAREKLPLLCDRRLQHEKMHAALTQLLGGKRRRPCVLVLLGCSDDEHWAFAERLETYSVPDLLRGTPLAPGESFAWIDDALPVDCDQDSFNQNLRGKIAAELDVAPFADDAALLRELNKEKKGARRSTLVAVLSWHVSELDRLPEQALRRLFDYWANFPDTGENLFVACIVCLKYERPKPARRSWLNKLFGAATTVTTDNNEVTALKTAVQRAADEYAQHDTVVWHTLPELPQVELADLERWRGTVRKVASIHVTNQQLLDVLDNNASLSMGSVLPKLDDLVTRP